MTSYLIHHYPRQQIKVGDGRIVYCDQAGEEGGNQDPYVWNEKFLHSFCHASQIIKEQDQIIFWVNKESDLNDKDRLLCDLIFVTDEIHGWQNANKITNSDQKKFVDSLESYNDHYSWAFQHPFKSRSRFTLKANSAKSFQPQDQNGRLIDITDGLEYARINSKSFNNNLHKAYYGTRPFKLDDNQAQALYEWLFQKAKIKLYGSELRDIRLKLPELASKHSKNDLSACTSCAHDRKYC